MGDAVATAFGVNGVNTGVVQRVEQCPAEVADLARRARLEVRRQVRGLASILPGRERLLHRAQRPHATATLKDLPPGLLPRQAQGGHQAGTGDDHGVARAGGVGRGGSGVGCWGLGVGHFLAACVGNSESSTNAGDRTSHWSG